MFNFKRTRGLSNAFRQLMQYNVRINKISELRVKRSLISDCTATMLLSSFAFIITKQLTSSVT